MFFFKEKGMILSRDGRREAGGGSCWGICKILRNFDYI